MKTKAYNKLCVITLVLILCFSVWGCPSGGSGGGPQEVAADVPAEDEETLTVTALGTDLETFDSCEDLEGYLKAQAIVEMEERIDANTEWYRKDYNNDSPSYPCIDCESDSMQTAAPDEGENYSTTNVQVEGVDEADFVKNDGEYIYLLNNTDFIIYKAKPGNETRELSRLEVEGYPLSMYVHEEKAVIFSQISLYGPIPCETGLVCAQSFMPAEIKTTITLLNIEDKESPELIREFYIQDATYRSSRRIGDIIRVVVASNKPRFDLPPYSFSTYYESDKPFEEALEELKQDNRSLIESASLSDWIPEYSEVVYSSEEEETLSGNLTECENFYRPVDPTGHGILSILTIDLNDPTAHQNDISLVADVTYVYASKDSLYVTTPRIEAIDDVPSGDIEPWAQSYHEFVKIHKFDIRSDPTRALYRASGEVEGHLLNQYSMDEHNGFLRVATTEGPWGDWTNNLFVLEEDEGRLEIAGKIREIAPGERIYAARFMGDRGYLVTFIQIDPLFTLDLSDPYEPKIVGELKVPGFSSYIHPLGENHLLAIGKDTDDAGTFAWFQGIQLSLFDVSDPSSPTLVDKVIGSRGSESEALDDPKAFNYFPYRDLLAVPIELYEGGTGGSVWGNFSSIGMHLYRVTPEEGFEFLGMVDHTEDGCLAGVYNPDSSQECDSYPSRQLLRSVIINDTIFSISNLLMRVSDLDDLSQLMDPIVFQPKDNLPLSASVEIAYKQELSNSEKSISISFDAIKEDSRCPQNVQCAWEGNASLTFTFSTNTESVVFDLNTYSNYQTKKMVFGYEIELLDVRPYPVSDTAYDPNEYSATIMVSE